MRKHYVSGEQGLYVVEGEVSGYVLYDYNAVGFMSSYTPFIKNFALAQAAPQDSCRCAQQRDLMGFPR